MKKLLFTAILGLICATFASAQKKYVREVPYILLYQTVDKTKMHVKNTGSESNPFNIADFRNYSYPNVENPVFNTAYKTTIYVIEYSPDDHDAYALKANQRLPVKPLTKQLYRTLKQKYGEKKVQILKKDIGYAYILDTEDLLINAPRKDKKPEVTDASSSRESR